MKKTRIILIILIAIVLGLFLILFWGEKSTNKETSKGTNMIDTINDDSKEKELSDNHKDTQNGLEVLDEPDETIDSVDGSGTWDEKHEGKTEPNHTESNKESEENILVDDKVWGDVR